MTQAQLTALATCLVIYLVAVNVVHSFDFKDCSGPKPDAKVLAVNFTACSLSEPYCTLVKGTNATINIQLQTLRPYKAARVKVYGKIGIVTIPFPFSKDDACAYYGLNCPAEVNQVENLSMTIPILRSYPSIKINIKFMLLDESKNPIMCVELPAKIQSSRGGSKKFNNHILLE